MSNQTLLYICGIVLAVSAVTVSLVGLKVKSFPGKAMPLVVLWFAVFVVGATTFAVLHAKDEDANKAKEARYEKAGEEFEREGGHVAPLGPGGQEEGAETEAEEGKEGSEEVEEEGAGGGEASEGASEGSGGEAAEGEKEAATTGR